MKQNIEYSMVASSDSQIQSSLTSSRMIGGGDSLLFAPGKSSRNKDGPNTALIFLTLP